MTDIVEHVEQKFRSGNSVPIDRAWLSADEWAQLRAEIVRLRGEVDRQNDEYLAALDSLHAFVGGRNDHPLYREFLRFVNTATLAPPDALNEQQKADRDLLLTGTSFMRDGKRIDPASVYIVPAEAKGVCATCNGHGLIDTSSGQTPDSYQQDAMDCPDCTPQPADGGAVAVGPLDLSAPPRLFLQVDTDDDDDDRSEAIPREAWGDLTWHHERIGGQEIEYVRRDLAYAPQSADGEVVAFYWRRDAAGDLLTIEVSEYESWGKDNRKEDTYSPAYTHPPAAQVQYPEFLKDPATVHTLMLRGVIAIPTWRSMVDLRGEVPNGENVQLVRIAELQEQLAAHPSACGLGAVRELPWNDDVRNILGRQNFSFIGNVQAMRAAGREIPRKAEEEQAYCLHWLLNLYLKHGAGWMEAANAELAALRPSAEAALQHRGDSRGGEVEHG